MNKFLNRNIKSINLQAAQMSIKKKIDFKIKKVLKPIIEKKKGSKKVAKATIPVAKNNIKKTANKIEEKNKIINNLPKKKLFEIAGER
jgi:hypothetical protein